MTIFHLLLVSDCLKPSSQVLFMGSRRPFTELQTSVNILSISKLQECPNTTLVSSKHDSYSSHPLLFGKHLLGVCGTNHSKQIGFQTR